MPTFLESLAQREHVAEQTQLALLQREERVLKRLRDVAKRQVLEDAWASADPYTSSTGYAAGLGSAANDLLHYRAIGRHSARPGSRQHGALPPFYFTEEQRRHSVEVARILEAFCPTAVCVLDVLSQFVIFTGFEYRVVPREQDGPQDLADEATEFIDKWQRDVDWYSWELELFRRTRRDGEAFLILQPDDLTGSLSLRSVEPEQVKEPQNRSALNRQLGVGGGESWRFGILTTKEDTSKPLGYWVVSQYNDTQQQGVFYEADEVFHLKTEWVDRQSKRGVSDFFCVANDLPGVRKLLRNLREGATVQAAIAWVREHPEGVMPEAMGGSITTTRTGRQAESIQYEGPTILSVPNGMKYTAGPLAGTGQSETLIQVLQAALRNIGARWQMPEGIVSGDASNANLASALVAEGPFTRALQARQWFYRSAYKRLIERVIDHAAIHGLLGPARENILDDIEDNVEMPPVVARKQKEETDRNALLNERGVLSNQSWAAREDLDFDAEQQNIEEDPIEPPSIMLEMDAVSGSPSATPSENSTESNSERVS